MLRTILAAALAVALTGCAGYTTYPAPESGGADAAFNSPNVPPAPDVIYTALAYTIDRFPVDGLYAINLPPELDPKRVDYIFGLLKDPDARTLTQGTENLPTYHVGRIWIRGAGAEVDVFRPVTDIPGPDGAQVTQLVTVKLTPRFTRWRVASARSAAIGVATPPEPFLLDSKSATAAAGDDDLNQ